MTGKYGLSFETRFTDRFSRKIFSLSMTEFSFPGLLSHITLQKFQKFKLTAKFFLLILLKYGCGLWT